jgi:hypothetical protein
MSKRKSLIDDSFVFNESIINNFSQEWKNSQPTEQTELYKYFITNYEIYCRTNYKINKIIYTDEKKIIDTTLYTNYKNNICARREYDVTLLNDINDLLPQQNNRNFDYIIIKDKIKLNEIISILILNKNECKNFDKSYNDIWSVSYICARGSKPGVASVMLGLSIYALKLKQNIIFLQLAQGYANISGFCSYYRFGFKENSNLDCNYYDKIENIKNIKMDLNLTSMDNENIFKVINDKDYIYGGKKLDVCSKIENRLELQRNLQTEYENKVLEKYRWKNDDYMNQILTTGKYEIKEDELKYINLIENKRPAPPPLPTLTAPSLSPPPPSEPTSTLIPALAPTTLTTPSLLSLSHPPPLELEPPSTFTLTAHPPPPPPPPPPTGLKLKTADDQDKASKKRAPTTGLKRKTSDDEEKKASKKLKRAPPTSYKKSYDKNEKGEYECFYCDNKGIPVIDMTAHVRSENHKHNIYKYDFEYNNTNYTCHFCDKIIAENQMGNHVLSIEHTDKITKKMIRVECDICKKWKLLSKVREINGDHEKDSFTCDTCLKRRDRGKSIKRKSIRGKSIRRKSIRKKSIRKKSIRGKSIRKSIRRKSIII